MLRLRIAAKPTHTMYGMSSLAATVDIFLKLYAVNMIVISSNIISGKARAGAFIPKKITDHSVFRVNCIA